MDCYTTNSTFITTPARLRDHLKQSSRKIVWAEGQGWKQNHLLDRTGALHLSSQRLCSLSNTCNKIKSFSILPERSKSHVSPLPKHTAVDSWQLLVMVPRQWSFSNDGPIPICIRTLQTDLSDLYKEKIKDMKLGVVGDMG